MGQRCVFGSQLAEPLFKFVYFQRNVEVRKVWVEANSALKLRIVVLRLLSNAQVCVIQSQT